MPPMTNGLICRYCGREFGLLASAVRRGRGKYCTRECSAAAVRSSRTVRCATKRARQCPSCGTSYACGPEDIRRLTCSTECLNRLRKRAGEQLRRRRAAAAISGPYTASNGSSFCLIALGRTGAEAIIDAEDADAARQFTWTLATHGYAVSGVKHGVYLHRLLMNPPHGYEVDHINRNKLDNRRCNLRIVDHGQNQQNIGATSASKTGVRGVWAFRGRFNAAVKVRGRRYWVGTFSTLGEAKVAVEAARARLMTHAEECLDATPQGCSICRSGRPLTDDDADDPGFGRPR